MGAYGSQVSRYGDKPVLFEMIWKSLPWFKREPLLYLVSQKENKTFRGPVHGKAPQSFRLAHLGDGFIK